MRFVRWFALGFVFVFLAASGGYSQQNSTANDASLGDIARKLNAEKSKAPKPAKVITNDNIGGPVESSGFGASSQAKSPPNSASEQLAAAGPAHGEQYFRSRLSSLQSQLDTHKRELDVLQQKLGQNQMQFYPNPQDSLTQQYSRSDINKLNADIDAKRQQIADDEKAIDDLHEELRRDGGDPNWLR
jgi:hypothetical protein